MILEMKNGERMEPTHQNKMPYRQNKLTDLLGLKNLSIKPYKNRSKTI